MSATIEITAEQKRIAELEKQLELAQETIAQLRKTNEILVSSMEKMKTVTSEIKTGKQPIKKSKTTPNFTERVRVPGHITGLVLGKEFSVAKAMCKAERSAASQAGVKNNWCRIDQDGEINEHGETFLVLKVSTLNKRVCENLCKRVVARIEQSLEYNRRNSRHTDHSIYRGYL